MRKKTLAALTLLLCLFAHRFGSSQDDVPSIYDSAQKLMAEGKMDEAVALFKRGTELVQYSKFLMNQDKDEEAIAILQKGAEKDPDDPDLLVQLAIAMQKLGRYEESIDYTLKSSQRKEEKGESSGLEFSLIAAAYENLGSYEKAESQLLTMLEGAKRSRSVKRIALSHSLLGELYLKESRYKKAAAEYSTVLSMLDSNQDMRARFLKAEALAGLGLARRRLGAYAQALLSLDQALTMAGQIPDREDSQKLLLKVNQEIADVLRDQGKFKDALIAYEKAYAATKSSGWLQPQLDLLVDLISTSRATGDFQKAESYLNEFVLKEKEVTAQKDKYAYLRVSAAIHENLGEYQKALELDQKRLGLIESKNRPLLKADCLQSVANDLVKLGRYAEALDLFEDALKIRHSLPHPSGFAYCLRRIGDIKEAQDKYRTARNLYEKARVIYEKIGRKDAVAAVEVDLGALESGLGNIPQAADRYERAQKIYRELGDSLEEAAQFTNLGQLYEAEGEQFSAAGKQDEAEAKHQKALEFNQKALEIKTELGAIGRTIVNLKSIGRQYMFLKQFDHAQEYLTKALETATRLNAKQQEMSIFSSLGELQWRQNHYREAEDYFSKIIAEQADNPSQVYWKIWYLLGLTQDHTDRKEEAVQSLEKAIRSIELIRRAASTSSEQERLFLNRYREVYQNLVELLIQQGKLEEAYYYIEKEKIAEFQQQTLDHRPAFGNKEKDDAYEKAKGYQFSETQIQQEIDGERSKTTPDEKLIENLKSLLGAIDKEFADYLIVLKTKFPDVVEQLQGDPRSLRSMKASIPEGVIVIQPIVLPRDKKVAILVYSRSVTFVRESPVNDVETFNEEIRHFLDLLRDEGNQDEVQKSGAQLYKWLIVPIERELKQAKLLVVSASGRMRKLPFQALYDEKSGEYLIQKIPVVNLALLKQLEATQASTGDVRIFAMANPDPENSELALPKAEEQVKNIQKSFPDMRIYLHEDAILERLRWKENDNNYNVLLFATHALLNDEQPAESHILLAKGQKLTYENIPQFSPFWPHVELVVLSACETAVAPHSENSAIDSLAENFDLIGIRSIVASLWQVNDDSTSILMTEFFKNLKEGQSLSVSLQKAQIELLKNPKYLSPYHWAPFVLIGDWR